MTNPRRRDVTSIASDVRTRTAAQLVLGGPRVALVAGRERQTELVVRGLALDAALRREEVHQRLHDPLRVGVGIAVLELHGRAHPDADLRWGGNVEDVRQA